MKINESGIFFISMLINIACSGIAISDEAGEFLKKPMMEQRATIMDYPLEQQIELYLNAMLSEHPADIALAEVLATNGAPLIPLLLRRLTEEDRPVAKMYIVDVFSRMQDLNVYSVVSDAQTMASLDEQVALMDESYWKEVSTDLIVGIRQSDESARP